MDGQEYCTIQVLVRSSKASPYVRTSVTVATYALLHICNIYILEQYTNITNINTNDLLCLTFCIYTH